METEEIEYFLDTYALIEIVKDNKNFERFKNTRNFTGHMNLLELHYMVSKEFGKRKADEIIDKTQSITINIEIKDIKEASKFRLIYIKNKFSYVDSLGYSMAFNRNMKFLTGDKEFKNLANVEFVK